MESLRKSFEKSLDKSLTSLQKVFRKSLEKCSEKSSEKASEKSLQKVFAKTLGDRDYSICEVVHIGFRLPLVFPLAECVTLNISGARVLKRRDYISAAEDDAPMTWDSKVDKFDDRRGGPSGLGSLPGS